MNTTGNTSAAAGMGMSIPAASAAVAMPVPAPSTAPDAMPESSFVAASAMPVSSFSTRFDFSAPGNDANDVILDRAPLRLRGQEEITMEAIQTSGGAQRGTIIAFLGEGLRAVRSRRAG